MANKETRVLKQDTLEILRQKTNEISLHVGDNVQLDALLADKTYNYTAAAGQVLFDGADNNSKVTRFELSPQHTVDNTGGSIILEDVSSLAASYAAGATIYQGSSGSETYQATIVSATTNKIIVRDSTGTFSTSADLKVGTSSPDTIANAKIARIIIESYPVAIARVYNAGTELTQGITANGFYAPKIVATSALSNSPSIGNSFSEGVTVYQNGTALNTQADIESSANWYGVLHSVDNSDEIRFKTAQGSFSATAKLRVLGSSDEIAAADHAGLTTIDTTYGSYIELVTPAAGSAAIKIFSLDIVAAINELQDDIGTVENLTTSANDVVLAINEHDGELGTITALAMGTTASTVSTAIKEHEDQIGNVDITGISGSNDTITGALEQLHNEVGDVTSSNLGTSASNLTAAVKEHEDQIGNENITSIDSGSNTITGALNQLHTEVGSLSLNTTAGDLTAAINEHEADIGDMTLTGLSASDLSAAVRELRAELGDHTTINDATGYSATTAVGGITELQGDIGNVDSLDTNTTSDVVAAINELENVLRDDTTQRTGYVMGTNANNVITAINEIEEVLRGGNSNYTLNTVASNVRDAINEHEAQIGNLVFGAGGPVDAANSTVLTGAINVLDAEIGSTSFTGADLTTAIKNTQDDILTAGSLTSLNTSNKFIVGAINEIEGVFDASALKINAGSDFVVDSSATIKLDVGTGGNLSILRNGTEFGRFFESGTNDFYIQNPNSDKDIILYGNDAGTVFEAVRFDMSQAGTATFNHDIKIPDDARIQIGSSEDLELYHNTSGNSVIKESGGGVLSLQSNGSEVNIFDTANSVFMAQFQTGGTVALRYAGITRFATAADGADVTGQLDVSGDVNVGADLTVANSLSIGGTTITATATELNIMDGGTTIQNGTLIDTDAIVINDGGTMKQFALSNFEPYFEDALDTLPNVTTVGTLNAGSIAPGFGNIDVGTGNSISGGAITGTSFVIGAANISEAELETIDSVTAGIVSASKAVVVDSNKDISGLRNVQINGYIDVDGTANLDTVDIDGTLDVALGSTLNGAVNITDTTGSTSKTTGALTVAGGVGINENLFVGGNLTVQGTQTILNTETLTVEDTLVLAGNNLSSEPTSGGFGLEVGPITNPSGVASGVTGAHSIVYNFATDQWEADGSLILSSATLGSPDVSVNNASPLGDLDSAKTLDINAGAGITVAGALNANEFDITITNADRGSAQDIFKNIAVGSVTIEASGNSDTVTFTDDNVVNVSGNAGSQTITLFHKNVFTDNSGTAGTFGQVNAQDGQYIKSLTLTAEGHVSAITTGDFDTRYQASNPAWNLKVSDVAVDSVANGESVDFRLAQVNSTDGLTISTTGSTSSASIITLGHADTSSIANLTSNNSGGTVIQDLTLTYDTYGHALTRSVTTTNLDNRYIRSFQLEDGDGTEVTIDQAKELKFVEGTGDGATIDINWSDTSTGSDADPYDLTFAVTNTDKGSSQNIFKNVQIQQHNGSIIYTNAADSNNDTLILREVQVSSTDGIALSNVADDIIGIAHANTSSASSSNNSGRTYIQDITIDTYGHVTGIGVATEDYVFTPPTYDGDDIDLDTGPLTGATVISDLDFNVTTNTFGHVTDANGTYATRNLTLTDLGFGGWDLEVNGAKQKDVLNNGTANWKNGNHITATYDNGVSFDHNTFTSGGTYTGGSDNGIVIEGFHIDSFGHIRNVQTRDLDSRFDKYQYWTLRADSGNDDNITTTEIVDFQGGNNITTTALSSGVRIDFDDPGYLLSANEKTATLTVVTSGGTNDNPILRLNDGSNDDVTIVGGTNVTVTRNSNSQLTIAATDTNTDVDVTTTNLKTRLGQLSGTINIGDSTTGDNEIVIRGDLTVQGSTTQVNTETVTVHDNIILLNSNATGNPTEDAGLEVERGNSPNVLLKYNESADRWQFTNNGSAYHNIPLSTEYMDSFKVEVDDGGNVTITDNEILGLRGGTAIETDVVATVSGENHTIQVKHADVSHTTTTASNQSLAYDGTFSAVTGVSVNSQGHVTEVITRPFTLPSIYSLPKATATARGGVELFSNTVQSVAANSVTATASRTYGVQLNSADQMVVNVPWSNTNTFRTIKVDTTNNGSANATLGATEELHLIGGTNVTLSESDGEVTINAAGYTLPVMTSTVLGGAKVFSNTQGGSANAVSSTAGRTYGVQLNSSNQLVVNVPWTDTDTNTNQLTSFVVEDGDSTDVTISHGKHWKFVEGSENVNASGNDYIQINWTDTSTGSSSDEYDLSFSHKRTSRSNTSTGSATTTFGGNFTIVDSVTTNATGHVTAVNTKTITMPANPNSDTFLDDVATVDNGSDMILRHSMNDGTSHDVGITAGTNITLTPGTETFEIATTAEANQNAFATFKTFNSGTTSTTDTASSTGDQFGINFRNGISTSRYGSASNNLVQVDVDSNQAGNIDTIGPSGSDNCNLFLEDGGGDTEDNKMHFRVGGTAVSHRKFTLDGNGKALFKDDVVAFSTSVSSDIKLKDNIEKVEGALEKVGQLDGVTFNWKENGKASAGVIAQNVEKVFPSAVKEVPNVDSDDTHLNVDYNQLSALFIEAIKELKEENKILRAEIESLKDINS